MADSPNNRLDMKHGFMKSIIKNQVDRDNYDKEVKAKQYEKPSKHPKHKKPDVGVYIPPMRQKKDLEREEMFCLEFEDKDGKVYTYPVFTTDKAGGVARRVGIDRQLPAHLVYALEVRVQEEMERRQQENLEMERKLTDDILSEDT